MPDFFCADEQGDLLGGGDGEVDDDVRIVELDGAYEVATTGGGEREVAVAGVFQAVDGAELASGVGEGADLDPGGVGEIVHRALGKAVGEGEDLFELGAVFGGEDVAGAVGAELGLGEGDAVELAQDHGLNAGGGGGGAQQLGAVGPLLAKIEVGDGAGAGHVAQMSLDVGQVRLAGELGEFAVFVAGGAKKALLQREAGGAIRQGGVAHVGVAVVETGDDDERALLERNDRLDTIGGGDGVARPGETRAAERSQFGTEEDDAIGELAGGGGGHGRS